MSNKVRSSRESSFPQRRRTPSFSSTLLDAIYRSIDESNGGEEVLSQYRETSMTKKQSNSVSTTIRGGTTGTYLEVEKEISNLGQAIMIESWMERQGIRRSRHYNSTSSSSDSSYGGGTIFSSSEAESNVKETSKRRSSSSFTPQRSKPMSDDKKQQKATCDGGGFTKTKSRALKIYGELKKVKQPISPGGRIASFLNSIFSSGSAKKVKMCSIGAAEDVTFDRKSKSACSSVSSFSRSCLSKTPPSRGNKAGNPTKRSVRFYPVSVIVDEDCRPCGHKCIYEDDPGLIPMPQKIVTTTSVKAEAAAKGADFVRSIRKKNVSEFDFRAFRSFVEDGDDIDDGYDEDDDDDESCSSSDLFELDHLIGIGRYREELPVYETTNLKTNQAIANGYIL